MKDFNIELAYKAIEGSADPKAWLSLGFEIDRRAIDPDEAEFCYRKTIALDPFNGRAHALLVCLLVDTKKYPAAMQAWDMAIDLLRDPESKNDDKLYSVLHYQVILHLLHSNKLALARATLLTIPPAILKQENAIGLAARAYGELRLIDDETALGLYIDRPLTAIRALPMPEINPIRY